MYRNCLLRQINEVENLQAMFCGQNELTLWNLQEYDALKRAVLGRGGNTFDDEIPQVAFQLQLPLDAAYPESASLVIRLKMPPFYPSSEHAEAHISLDLLTPAQEQVLRDVSATFVEAKLGHECVLDLVQFAKEWVYDHCPPPKVAPTPTPTPTPTPAHAPTPTPASVSSVVVAPAAPAAPKAAPTQPPAKSVSIVMSLPDVPKQGPIAKPTPQPAKAKPKARPPPQPKEQEFRRILIWFSTIAPDRAKTVADWAKQLGLTGISRLGSPALIVVEGQREDVDEYVQSLRSYRWKKMEIVWEEKSKSTNINSCRRFPNYQECMLPLPDLQQIFKKAGLEDMYKEGLKIRG